MPRPTIQERFESHVHHEPNTGCWLWDGMPTGSGHGQFWLHGRLVAAHRYAWEQAHGPIPEGAGYHGTCVLHRCDVYVCVNPGHLFLGTHADNMADMAKKGRAQHQSGEDNPTAILTWARVAEIRSAVAGGEEQRVTAARHGVSQATVWRIARGLSWVIKNAPSTSLPESSQDPNNS